jgi:hypothetical protein
MPRGRSGQASYHRAHRRDRREVTRCPAFTQALAAEASVRRRWIISGSGYDIVDTGMRTRDGLILDVAPIMVLKSRAGHKKTVIGHPRPTEPMTFGMKSPSGWRWKSRMERRSRPWESSRGAVGTFAHSAGHRREDLQRLGLTPAPIAAGAAVDRYAKRLYARDRRLDSRQNRGRDPELQRTEIREVEGSSPKQKGLCHPTRDPVISEQVSGLSARVIGATSSGPGEHRPLERRDISHCPRSG